MQADTQRQRLSALIRDGRGPAAATAPSAAKMLTENLNFYYGGFHALSNISLEILDGQITAIIGPSGCGKSTFLRTLNRMQDQVPGARVEGRVLLDGRSVYGVDVDAANIRTRVGMVFQRPNPFPKSIFDNVAFGPRMHGLHNKAGLRDLVEQSLRLSALWDEVKDKLKQPAYALSGGQQQRLCIARALAMQPEVLLMDEPASALDPIATSKIEDLMLGLRERYTIVIVTHNMQQAARVSDRTAFFMSNNQRAGFLVEVGPTAEMFTNPKDRRTEDYISGRFG